MQSLVNAMGALPYPVMFTSHSSANVWRGRNQLVEHFLTSEADYLLFVDADMVFEPEHMDTLVKAMVETQDAGLIGGYYVSRDQAMRPLLGWMNDDETAELPSIETIPRLLEARGKMVECDLVATGFMIIRREVLETLKDPWFIVKSEEGEDGEMLHWSSDNVFVQKVRRAGYKTYGHFGVELGHIGNYVFHPQLVWPEIVKWNANQQLADIKVQLGANFGWNTKQYWDSLYSVEGQLGRVREYPLLHKAICAGVQEHWRVLDVGSGPGILAAKIFDNASEVVCKDLSEYAVKQCRELGMEAEEFDLVNDEVPMGEHGLYDCVVCTEVLEHIEDAAAAVKKLYSFLKPEGLIMLSVPDDRLPPEEEPEHVTTYTAAKLAVLMKPFEEVFVEPVAGYLLGVGKKPPK